MRFLAGLAALATALFTAAPALAQAAPVSLAGTYDGRQMEVAAALVLGEDGRFEYYLSYGALDETSTGTWTAENGTVVLDSDPVAAPAFELVESDKGRGGRFEVALEVPQGLPVQLFSAAVVFSDGTAQVGDFREERLRLPIARGRTVAALHIGFPVFGVASGPIEVPEGTRSMRFRFVPNDLGKIAFDHEVLRIDRGGLTMERHDRTLTFRRVSG